MDWTITDIRALCRERSWTWTCMPDPDRGSHVRPPAGGARITIHLDHADLSVELTGTLMQAAVYMGRTLEELGIVAPSEGRRIMGQ